MNKNICGRDCVATCGCLPSFSRGKTSTLTLLQDSVYTAIPFTHESLRLERLDYSLSDTLVARRQVRHTVGKTIAGCFVSLLTSDCVVPLFNLLTNRKSFDIIVKRGKNTIVYRNLSVKSFELRGRLDEHIYLRIDVLASRNGYVTGARADVPLLDWEQQSVWHLRRGNWDSDLCRQETGYVYNFCLTGDFTGNSFFELDLSFPLLHSSVLGVTGGTWDF